MRERLVLWDVDHTLLNAGGLSSHLYGLVFAELFGRPLPRVAPMAGRTDRAIIVETLTLAGGGGRGGGGGGGSGGGGPRGRRGEAGGGERGGGGRAVGPGGQVPGRGACG